MTIVIIIFSPGPSANNVSNDNKKWESQREAVGAGYEQFLAVNHTTLNSSSLGVLQSTMVMQHFGQGGGDKIHYGLGEKSESGRETDFK